MKWDQPSSPEKIDYIKILSSIEKNNGRLKDIAHKLLARPDLLALVPATLDATLLAYGVNSITPLDERKIGVKGIRIHPAHMTEEVSVHELIHFFSMPALAGASQSEQEGKIDKIDAHVKKYWTTTKKLWEDAKKQGYKATNASSVHDTIVEFAVNFTNKESEEKLKALKLYDQLVEAFFEYYNSLKIRKE